MSEFICFLLSLFEQNSKTITKVALRVLISRIGSDCIDYPMEPENREFLFNLLPDYIQDIGPIVAVEIIHDMVNVKKDNI